MPSPHDPFDYNAMIHDALRSVVRKTLLLVKEFGMPTDHHFYITFKTMAPQVVLPLYLRQKYPESVTIVLQYQFLNLTVTDSAFSVTLSFGGKFETLTVPFSAIAMFSDPEAQLVFNFDPLSEPFTQSEQSPEKTSSKSSRETLDEPLGTADKESAEKPLSTIGARCSAGSQNIAPTWHASVALSAKDLLEPRSPTPREQSKLQDKRRGNLKPVATKTSAKVLTFRPKHSELPHDNKPPSKRP